MIANITQGSVKTGIGNLVGYLLNPKKNPEILSANFCNTADKNSIQNSFLIQSSRHKTLQKDLLHISFSFAIEDCISEVDYLKYLEEYVTELRNQTTKSQKPIDLNLETTQHVVIQHIKDTKHQHFHVIFNRVAFNLEKDQSLRIVKDNYIKIANKRACYAIAAKHNLKLNKTVQTPEMTYEKAFARMPNIEKYKDDPQKIFVKNIITPVCHAAIEEEDNLDDFFKYLKSNLNAYGSIRLNKGYFSVSLKDNYKTYFRRKNGRVSFNMNAVSPAYAKDNLCKKYDTTTEQFDKTAEKVFNSKAKENKPSIYTLVNSCQTWEEYEINQMQNPIPLQDKRFPAEKDVKLYFQTKKNIPYAHKTLFTLHQFRATKNEFKRKIENALKASGTQEEFLKNIEKEGLQALVKLSAERKIVGLNFLDPQTGINLSGSYIDYKFSAKNLEKQISKNR